MRIHCLQHEAFEGAANIASWAHRRGWPVSYTHLYDGEDPPDSGGFDWLLVMGGGMNIYEEEKFPWLRDEKSFLKKVIETDKTVIGICLGAQLIADVLGAPTSANTHKEIGWHEVKTAPEALAHRAFAHWPERFVPCHWHGDAFARPEGAVPIGSSEVCRNQGFIWRDRVVALQFHIEYSADSIRAMVTECGHELVPSPYVQSADTILRDVEKHVRACQPLLDGMLDALCQTKD